MPQESGIRVDSSPIRVMVPSVVGCAVTDTSAHPHRGRVWFLSKPDRLEVIFSDSHHDADRTDSIQQES